MPTSVAHPCDDSSLARAVDAAKLGARVPITLTRRADSAQSRLASCTVAVLVAYRRRESAAKVN
jgi:hypothetical protein